MSRARKRQFDEMAERNAELQELFDHLRGQSDENALSVVRSLRSNVPLESILGSIRRTREGTSKELQHSRALQYRVLSILTQSAVSLRQLLELVDKVPPPKSLPTHSWERAIDILQGRPAVTPALLGSLLQPNSPSKLLTNGSSESQGRPVGPYKGPTFWVPAQPWLSPGENDDASVSHMVSVFLGYVNPFYRFVEEDLFLAGMRSHDPQSRYCSPFLVNAVLACASVSFPDRCQTSSYRPFERILIIAALHGQSTSVFNAE